MPALIQAGHDVSLCYESDQPSQRVPVDPPGTVAWCARELGIGRTIEAVRQWRPDVIYSHNLEDLELERELLKIAPAVFFAHAYYGTCISGSKAFSQPIPRPCSRLFGWQCLLHFYPKRCGGMNPLTMLGLYRRQLERLVSLRNYRAVVTHSEYLRAEYVRHGIAAEQVFLVPYCVRPLRQNASEDPPKVRMDGSWRLVFAGRLDSMKGGELLLKALPLVRSASGKPLQLVFAGDGPERENWGNVAAALTRSQPDIKVEFAGWLADEKLGALLHTSHLLVVPSIWPEPFGMVGVEAAIEGVPAAAFDVGGIPTWLIDGVSGHLASGDPPTAEGLAQAIVRCLGDHKHYLELCSGAANSARRFTVQPHLQELIRRLEWASQNLPVG
jgi:glycosyltransferase involved in cell wall biosynthesis